MRLNVIKVKDIKESEKVALANSCLNLCNKCGFPTDYNDVYEHILGDPRFINVFAMTDDGNLVGFLSVYPIVNQYKGIKNVNVLLEGGIVDPAYQGKGLIKAMTSKILGFISQDLLVMDDSKFNLVARSQNPAIYRLMDKFSQTLSPTTKGEIDKELASYLKSIKEFEPFIGNFDDFMIVKNAYPSRKIQVKTSLTDVNNMFFNLPDNDAYIMFGKGIKDYDKDVFDQGAYSAIGQYMINLVRKSLSMDVPEQGI